MTTWTDIGDEPATKGQRMACYRLGLSPHFVHKFVLTNTQANIVIACMIELHKRMRGKGDDNT